MNKSLRLLGISTFLVLATILIVWLTTGCIATSQPNRGVALDDLMHLYRDTIKPLGGIVVKTYHEFRGNSIQGALD